MKKTIKSLIFAGVALIALSSCGGKNEHSKSSENSTGKQEIVYVNTDSLLSQYKYYKEIKRKLEEKGKMEEASLQAKGMAFQKEVANYQQNASRMTASQREAEEMRLGKKQQQLQQYNQTASMQLAKEEQIENEKLYKKISDYLKEYAKDNGYKMVLTYSKLGGGMLYGDANLDITEDVIKGLNKAE